MHLCYIDDSGHPQTGITLTALLIGEDHWNQVLSAWLDGRREIHREFGVPKTAELHAVKLYKGRGEFCETAEQEAKFSSIARAAAGRVMLSHISKNSSFTVVSVGAKSRSTDELYARFIAFLEDWAETRDTRLLVFYDGQTGVDEDGERTAEERSDLWERAIRAAAPYRAVHRNLDLSSRRVIEDVVMQDSKYSQLIQAVDLIAYGAYHKHLQNHPEIWGQKRAASSGAIRAYMQTSGHWLEGSDFGMEWLD
ncbi:DUF3800 domain-containing protein [Microbacterium sp. VKM Ac-2923]|uniref:DUF3800 domain-containing protein n=1 Tax=Microbacterium sp. VKM Ac-2923 TaxID=2929476 RepID=UPI001FB52FE5|nr:DUF3800 domain-containing protein [Microbacterium sp. VKM Ac-2923]MCJ1709531.1 DUF3800 domain-containing protein [Microbacterium sp. VKM Ac-2923]